MLLLVRSEICKNYDISDSPIPLDENALSALYKLSKKHDLAHITGAALERRSLIPKESPLYTVFAKETALAVYRLQHLSSMLATVSAALENACIAFIPLKGSVLRDRYPEPWQRTSSDVDIFVRERDLAAAERMLTEKCGYTKAGTSAHDVSFRSPDGMHLELHYRLIEDAYTKNAAGILTDPFSYATPKDGYAYHHVLSDDFFYLYHVAHMAKHFENGGCGVRSLLDLWILENNLTYDASARDTLLSRADLLTFANAMRSLSDAWFNGGSADETVMRAGSLILFSGVYGTKKTRVQVQQQRKGGKLGYALSRIFLPYETLKHHYPVLKKHPILTPLCEIRRWCRLLFLGGAKRSLDEFRMSADVSEKEAADIRGLMESIGL